MKLFLFLFFFLPFLTYSQDPAGAVALRSEYLIRPLGLDNPNPRLTWKLDDPQEGAVQTAYRIVVGMDSLEVSQGQGAFVWDTGKVASAAQLVTYDGLPLQPFGQYYWKVELWGKSGEQYASSGVSCFEMGMMEVGQWQGTWISDHEDVESAPAPFFRKEFTVEKQIKSARAYISAGGLYELSLNGEKVSDQQLDPMFTRFDRRNLYVSYDVTAQVQAGENAIGVILGNGWYNHQSLAVWNFDKAPWRARPTFCLDIKIAYTDGSSETIRSDRSWKTRLGPIVLNSIYTAEHYDSRIDLAGWDLTGYNEAEWKSVAQRSAPSAQIVSQAMHPIRVNDTIPVKTFTKFSDTSYVFDLGRNIAGVSKLRVFGDSGTVVRVKHGERLLDNGQVDMSNIDVYFRGDPESDPFQTDILYLNGRDTLNFMPRFNYKGFQYVEVSSNRPISLDQDDLVGYFMHSDVPVTGRIHSSDTLINKLWAAANASYLSNLFGYPTDCPQREKNGWTGDGHLAIEAGLLNFDGITVYEKWMADFRDEQQPNGVLPDIIPTGGWGYGTANGTDWTGAIAIIPWNLYLYYGDRKPLQDNYQAMKQYVDYVERTSTDGLTSFGRGDWVPVKSTSPLEYTSSVYYYVITDILARTAKLLDQETDYAQYTALAKTIRDAINAKYLDVEKGIYGGGNQTEQSLALYWKIVPQGSEARVAAKLAERVKADNYHLDVGVLGCKAVLNALNDYGYPDEAHRLAVQDTYPSWGWWIRNGATTLYENWDLQATRDISLNHMMFGEIGAWFYKGLGGIFPDETQPGFKHFLLRPNFPGNLEEFASTYESPYGTIQSSWKRTGKEIVYEATIPANSSATLYLPEGNELKERKLNAGTYRFEVSMDTIF